MNDLNQLNEGLDYAQMLEIPVSTVNVVKKRSIFSRRNRPQEDLKARVVESVNGRAESFATDGTTVVGDDGFLRAEDLSPSIPSARKKDRLKTVFVCEAVIACLLAVGIFLCNIFLPNTAINTFVGNLTAVEMKETPYNQFTLTSPVSETSDAAVAVTSEGVLHFTDKTSVYPLCDGKVASVAQTDGAYTVKIMHTSSFCSIVTGLDSVYASEGEQVKGNLPFAYSNGEGEVRISMYDGDELLNCYTLTGAIPVWNS